MEKKYFLQENGQVSQPYSLDDLRTKNIRASTSVCVKFGEWKYAKDIPELGELLDWQPPFPIEPEWVPPLPQIQTPKNKNDQLSKNKTVIIVIGAILVAAFFMPWIKAFVSLNAWDLVFGSAGELIDSSFRYVVVVIPISGILIIYGAVGNKEDYPISKSILFILPVLTLFFVGIIIINKIGTDLDSENSNGLGQIMEFFGIGFWLTLICAVILPFLGQKITPKFLGILILVLAEVFIVLYFIIKYLPLILAFASSLLGLLLTIVLIPLIIWGLIKLNKHLYSKL